MFRYIFYLFCDVAFGRNVRSGICMIQLHYCWTFDSLFAVWLHKTA